MFEDELKRLMKQAKVEKPTYLGHNLAFDSLILNQRNEKFFYKKRIKLLEAKDLHGFMLENWFTYETIVNLWYLFHLIDGGLNSPLKLTKYERQRIAFVITKMWQDKLPDYKERLNNVDRLKDFKKLDLFKTINELLQSSVPKEDEVYKKLKELDEKLHPDINDEDLLKEFYITEEKLIGSFDKITGFQSEMENLRGIVSELFQKNIFMGYRRGFIKILMEDVIKHFPKTFISLYIFRLEIDRGIYSPKYYYKRLKRLKKSVSSIVDKMTKTFSGPDAEEIGWIDTVLIVSPAVTFLNNLDTHMKYYRKLFKGHIDKKGQANRYYEKEFIRGLYFDIKNECEVAKIDKKPIDILLEVFQSLSAVLTSYNKIYATNLDHLSYDYDNIQKIIKNKL